MKKMRMRAIKMTDELWEALQRRSAELEAELQVRVGASSLVRKACIQWLKHSMSRSPRPARTKGRE